jgi:membrane protein implicated in regulation of membrane protease activity
MGSAIGMTLTFWHWLAVGGLLLLLEVFTPGFVFMWLALAAVLTGIALCLAPTISWQVQVLIFAAAAVASVAVSFYWRRGLPLRGGDPLLNNRALGYVGTETELVGAIGPGHGRVRIADSTWPAAGPELPAGPRVRIIGVRGAVLLVMPVAGDGRPDSDVASESSPVRP